MVIGLSIEDTTKNSLSVAENELRKVEGLAELGEMVIMGLQVKALHSGWELKCMLKTLGRRGAFSRPIGDGRYRLSIPTDLSWIPFYKTIRDCKSVELTEVTTISQRRTILIEPEG